MTSATSTNEIFTQKNGSFECGDKPLQITKACMKSGRLILTVQWHPRPHDLDNKLPGFTPQETVYTNSELKKYNPLLLCEYYEKLLKVNIKGREQSECISVTSNEREYVSELN
jgi:hypothetical protein